MYEDGESNKIGEENNISSRLAMLGDSPGHNKRQWGLFCIVHLKQKDD